MLKSIQDQRQRLNKIYPSFVNNCSRFAQNHQVGYTLSAWPYYGKKQIADRVAGNVANFDFGNFTVVFSYCQRTFLPIAAGNILRFDISLDVHGQKQIIPTDVLMDILNPNDFTPFIYQDITDETLMAAAFEALNALFMKYRSDIDHLLSDPDALAHLLSDVHDDKVISGGSQFKESIEFDALYFYFKTTRFTWAGYEPFLLGDYKKSLAKYQKYKKMTFSSYEQRMIELMKTRSSISGYQPESLVSSAFEDQYRYINPFGYCAYTRQNGSSILLSVLINFAFTVPLAYGLLWILYTVLTSGTLFASQPAWIIGVLTAFVWAIMASPLHNRKIHQRLYPKDHERFLTLKALYTSELDLKSLNFLSYVVSLVFLLFLVFSTMDLVTLREKTFTADRFFYDMTLLKPYAYDQIDHVEYRPTLTQDGEERPFENYTLVMKDGREFHLFSTVTMETIESEILPILIEKNVTIKSQRP